MYYFPRLERFKFCASVQKIMKSIDEILCKCSKDFMNLKKLEKVARYKANIRIFKLTTSKNTHSRTQLHL